jgi:hypothetical protein
MIGLPCFVVAVWASPFKSKIRLEAENATLRHQLVVLRRKLKGRARLTNNDRWFFRSVLSLVSGDPSGSHDYSTRNAGTLASGRLSPLLALEIASTGRATADRGGIARADPADGQGEFALGSARIDGELLKLGFELAQSSLAKYIVKDRGPPSPGVADLSSKPRAEHCLHGFVRCPDN